ncbi:MAG TPA: protease inhibitor I9 family protein, partial [Pyrinomonadaceae bacterium]|nr:protease inhibitor I9 family protein [Pyrinomonadaceae bacterium]
MKKNLVFMLAAVFILALLLGSPFSVQDVHAVKVEGEPRAAVDEDSHVIPDQYIVVLKDGVAKPGSEPHARGRTVSEAADELTRLFGGEVLRTWDHVLRGYLVQMPSGAAEKLARHPWVKSVESDLEAVATSAAPPVCFDFGTNTYPPPLIQDSGKP